MRKTGAKSPFKIKLFVIIFIVLFAVVIITFSIKTLMESNDINVYDLGEKDKLTNYVDEIVTDYNVYSSIMDKYNLKKHIDTYDFEDNSYLITYQEYDPCGESKFSKVEKIEVSNSLDITFRVYNKCGWCKKHLVMHVIKIPKVDPNISINYDYKYDNNLNCGSI